MDRFIWIGQQDGAPTRKIFAITRALNCESAIETLRRMPIVQQGAIVEETEKAMVWRDTAGVTWNVWLSEGD